MLRVAVLQLYCHSTTGQYTAHNIAHPSSVGVRDCPRHGRLRAPALHNMPHSSLTTMRHCRVYLGIRLRLLLRPGGGLQWQKANGGRRMAVLAVTKRLLGKCWRLQNACRASTGGYKTVIGQVLAVTKCLSGKCWRLQDGCPASAGGYKRLSAKCWQLQNGCWAIAGGYKTDGGRQLKARGTVISTLKWGRRGTPLKRVPGPKPLAPFLHLQHLRLVATWPRAPAREGVASGGTAAALQVPAMCNRP